MAKRFCFSFAVLVFIPTSAFANLSADNASVVKPMVSTAVVLDPRNHEPLCQVLASESPELFPGSLVDLSAESLPIARVPMCGRSERALLQVYANYGGRDVKTASPFLLEMIAPPPVTCLLAAGIGFAIGYSKNNQDQAVREANSSYVNTEGRHLDTSWKSMLYSSGGASAAMMTLTSIGRILTPEMEKSFFLRGLAQGGVIGLICGGVGGQIANVVFFMNYPH